MALNYLITPRENARYGTGKYHIGKNHITSYHITASTTRSHVELKKIELNCCQSYSWHNTCWFSYAVQPVTGLR